jgi:hypothetical protein
MRRTALRAAACALAGLGGVEAWGYCPSYTLSSPANTYDCGIEAVPGTNPSVAEWKAHFQVVAGGPAAWGPNGPSVPLMGQGCGKPEPAQQVPARFPCELLGAIAQRESGWKQFCAPDRPSDQVGKPSQTLISFDCGYGISQVTSGMHVGEAPGFDRARVAANPLYNLATGASILAGKWRSTACVGDNQPTVVEHWYTATWAYNGLAYINNPNNPTYSSARGAWKPSVGGAAPYQEKIFGSLEYPPSDGRYAQVQVAYPALADIGTGTRPPALPEPACATPTSCATARGTHRSGCFGGAADGGLSPEDGGQQAVDGGEPSAPDGGPPSRDAGHADGGAADAGLEYEAAVGGCGCGTLPGGAAWLLGALVSGWATRRGARGPTSRR